MTMASEYSRILWAEAGDQITITNREDDEEIGSHTSMESCN